MKFLVKAVVTSMLFYPVLTLILHKVQLYLPKEKESKSIRPQREVYLTDNSVKSAYDS